MGGTCHLCLRCFSKLHDDNSEEILNNTFLEVLVDLIVN